MGAKAAHNATGVVINAGVTAANAVQGSGTLRSLLKAALNSPDLLLKLLGEAAKASLTAP